MKNEKRFRTALFGFNKLKVNEFLTDLVTENERILNEKNDEILQLSMDYRKLRPMAEALPATEARLSDAQDSLKKAENALRELTRSYEELLGHSRALESRAVEIDERALALDAREAEIRRIEEIETDALRKKTAEYDLQVAELNRERIKVTEILINAKEKAESMLAEAKDTTISEIERRSKAIEAEQARYLEFKDFLRTFREHASHTFSSLDEIIMELIERDEFSDFKSK